MVDIYLHSNLSSSSSSSPPLLLVLSVPLADAHRLSHRPLKWFRFMMFAICGAKGDLFQSDLEGGVSQFQAESLVLVNYSSSIDKVVGPYYYIPDGPCTFIDSNVLNDSTTSLAMTNRGLRFRHDVIRRDGPHCTITHREEHQCDACHLIPRSKGDKYIDTVTRLRSARNLYDQPLRMDDIDAVENGILMNKILHSDFGHGRAAFLKTPNFALDPEDIPGLDGPLPAHRITLQYLTLSPHDPSCQDAVFDNNNPLPRDGNHAPPALLLDFCYGAAAYKVWGTGEGMKQLLHNEFVDQYQPILAHVPARKLRSHSHSGSSKSSSSSAQSRGGGGLSEAMDDMTAFVLHASGMTTEARMARWREVERQQEVREKEVSERKVLEWMKNTSTSSASHDDS